MDNLMSVASKYKSKKKKKSKTNKVDKVMHEWKSGTLKSSSGQKVTSRKQAIAIALSEQRRWG
jgi:hypothetical protein